MNQWPLLVPIVLVGLPFIAPEAGAAAGGAITVGVAATLFELAA